MQYISDQRNSLVVSLHNAWCRVRYVYRVGLIPALHHRHVFNHWTGARNLLCWCGGVKVYGVEHIDRTVLKHVDS